jgi:hypothetical protein
VLLLNYNIVAKLIEFDDCCDCDEGPVIAVTQTAWIVNFIPNIDYLGVLSRQLGQVVVS